MTKVKIDIKDDTEVQHKIGNWYNCNGELYLLCVTNCLVVTLIEPSGGSRWNVGVVVSDVDAITQGEFYVITAGEPEKFAHIKSLKIVVE